MKFEILKNNKKTTTLLILTILWMAVIFFFSSQPGGESSLVSGTVRKIIVEFIEWLFSGHPPGFIGAIILNSDHIVRKTGHVVEYAILGVLVVNLTHGLRIRMYFPVSALICFLYAASDEFHQVFVPGRGPMVSDVMLDTAGALAGMGLFTAIVLLRRRVKTS